MAPWLVCVPSGREVKSVAAPQSEVVPGTQARPNTLGMAPPCVGTTWLVQCSFTKWYMSGVPEFTGNPETQRPPCPSGAMPALSELIVAGTATECQPRPFQCSSRAPAPKPHGGHGPSMPAVTQTS